MFSSITSTSISRIATPQLTIHVVSCVYNMEQWFVPFLVSIRFLFIWVSLWLGCVKNALKILQLSKDGICLDPLQDLFWLVFLIATLYHEVMGVFHKRVIPVKNLLAVLIGSCTVMRDSKTGLDKRLCDGLVPHLLGSDRDLCHHFHNTVKKFHNNFDNYLEKLFPDFYINFDLSADICKRLELLCYHITVLDVCIDLSTCVMSICLLLIICWQQVKSD